MDTPQTTKPRRRKSASAKTAPELEEEIERIQVLLRRLDEQLKGQNISLKDLAQAVRTAGEGGRSIAQLRKMARQLGSLGSDQETEQLRSQLLDMFDALGRRREQIQAAPPDSPPTA